MARRRWAVAVALSALLPLTSCAAKGSTTTSTPASAPMPTAAPAVATTLSSGETQYAAPDQGAVMWGMSEERRRGAEHETGVPARGVARPALSRRRQTGRPWRVQADAAWLMSSEGRPTQVDEYLTTRQSQGFNSFYLMAMVHPGGYKDAAPNAPNDLAGDPPFATPNDFSTAVPRPRPGRYWQWIDTIIAKAADHGMAVMLAYTYLGFRGGDQGLVRRSAGAA